jgi:hypothetical protein
MRKHEALADKLAAKIIDEIIPYDHCSIVTAAVIDSVADRLRERAKDLRRGDEDEAALYPVVGPGGAIVGHVRD